MTKLDSSVAIQKTFYLKFIIMYFPLKIIDVCRVMMF
jgi:hypothetical protein